MTSLLFKTSATINSHGQWSDHLVGVVRQQVMQLQHRLKMIMGSSTPDHYEKQVVC